MNLAQLFKLPVIYVCENNLYTEYTHYSETTAGDILMRATAFGLDAASRDGQDVARSAWHRAKIGGSRPPRLMVPDSCSAYLSLPRASRGRHQPRVLRARRRKRAEMENGARSNYDFGKWLIDEKIADAAALDEVQAELRRR